VYARSIDCRLRACSPKSVAVDGAFSTLRLLPPSDGVAVSVCSLPLGSRDFALTNGLTHRTPSSNLRFGRAPPSYGAFPPSHGTPFNGPSPPPYAPSPAAPGPAHVRPPGLVPRPTGGPSQKRTSIVISRGLAICLVIMLIQSVLIICRSDVLAKYIDLESAALRLSREKSALVVEREKSERERVRSEQEREMLKRERVKSEREMRELRLQRDELRLERNELKLEKNELKQERVELEQQRVRLGREMQEWERERRKWKSERGEWELERGRWEWEKGGWRSEREKLELERERLRLEREWWERAREDRVPQGAFWEGVWPAWDCRAYGKREYWGTLQSIPEGWTAMDACMNMPVEIKGVTVRRPDRCAFVEGSPHIHGYWMVDWDQPDCKPWYRDFHDAVSPIPPFYLYAVGILTRLRDV